MGGEVVGWWWFCYFRGKSGEGARRGERGREERDHDAYSPVLMHLSPDLVA